MNLTDLVYSQYISKQIGKNNNCIECRICFEKLNKRKLKNGPVPIYHIGNRFDQLDKRVLFLGLVAYGWADIYQDFKMWDDIFNKNEQAIKETQEKMSIRIRDLYFTSTARDSSFFYWLRRLTKGIYGNTEIAYDSIAISNFVKCNDASIRSPFKEETMSFCTSKENGGYIIDEINTINPTHIVVLSTQYEYYNSIKHLISEKGIRIKNFYHPSYPTDKDKWISKIIDFIKSD
jgi:hypothetical protein